MKYRDGVAPEGRRRLGVFHDRTIEISCATICLFGAKLGWHVPFVKKFGTACTIRDFFADYFAVQFDFSSAARLL
jgi:hypothetical protein